MLGVDDGDAGTVCGVCSGLAMKTPERCHWRRAGVFIVSFVRGWRLVLVFCCSLLAGKCWLGISNFNEKFLLTNEIFD